LSYRPEEPSRLPTEADSPLHASHNPQPVDGPRILRFYIDLDYRST
jgi:hypothetical protein